VTRKKKVVFIGIDPQVMQDKQLCDLIKTTQIVLEKALELLKEAGDERLGGFTTIIREDLWPLVVRIPMGVIPVEKVHKWSELSTEKCLRLMQKEEHFASYESRDPEAKITTLQGEIEEWGQWGGGIKAWKHLLGFSGLPELWDEALELVVAVKTDLLNRTIALNNISSERNPHFRILLAAVEC
jgi:hypothetical protein